ncbi:ADP-ribose pyrophosphatase YjhB (NUDIX family) [Leucobacter luti]|uniref:ADP-ribose pyrophosphatase YjhB (NUDIX family) n=2 Tax=Leucobacter luti TaxID=340320 RepID=A0A4R6S763_9MICO|nr:ADP-ribose pyrophosphatase YjhB (NUDIX family) [Leucobacter luti]TDP95749.1 ADP-ribose pyrophosphatase YjhB (NUDIX family) [Leucobacter luti]
MRHNGTMSIDTAELPDPEGPEDRPAPAGNPGWLSDDELEFVRGRMPILYVEAVPVRLDGLGKVIEVGLLLRSTPDGVMTRAFVSGRVRFGEPLREALFRHLEDDLGPMAFPQMPTALLPAQVAEYFPLPGISAFVDERQHAVSLVYVVPVTGTCNPRQDALEVTWMSPEEALSPDTLSELGGGRGSLLRQALATVGC